VKKQVTYKGKPIKIRDISTETLKARRAWSEVYWTLNENNFSIGYSRMEKYKSSKVNRNYNNL
jgi:hypothetical protein